MKVLFFSYAYPPHRSVGAVTVGGMTAELAAQGLQAEVVTAAEAEALDPPGIDRIVVDDPLGRVRTRARDVATRAEAVQGTYARAKQVLNRALFPDAQGLWAARAVRAAVRAGGPWDAVVSSGPPHSAHLAAGLLAHRARLPHVLWLRDVWAGNVYLERGDRSARAVRWLEDKVIAAGAGVIAATPGISEEYRRRTGKPVETVLTGVEAALVNPGDARRTLPFEIVHTGSVYSGRRDPRPLFKALQRLPDHVQEGMRVTFVGAGDGTESVRRAASAHAGHWEHVLVPFLDRREVIERQRRASVLLTLTWDNEFDRNALPAKMYEYLAARRPILLCGCVDGDAARLIRSLNRGCASNDPDEIGAFLHALWSAADADLLLPAEGLPLRRDAARQFATFVSSVA